MLKAHCASPESPIGANEVRARTTMAPDTMTARMVSMRFQRLRSSLVAGVAFGVPTMVLIGDAVTTNVLAARVFGLATGVPALRLSARGFRSATVILSDEFLIVRTVLRRRCWPISQVRGATIEPGIIGIAMWKRRFPVIHLIDGQDYECRELNTSPKHAGELEPIITAINRVVLSANGRGSG